MIEVTDKVLEQMVAAIVGEVAPEKIILFGSRAAGRSTTDSDVDLLVVTPKTFDDTSSRRNELLRIRRILSPFRVAKDVLVYSTQEMDKWKHSINHVIAEAMREGKVLYERP